jgi:hypothetical protein
MWLRVAACLLWAKPRPDGPEIRLPIYPPGPDIADEAGHVGFVPGAVMPNPGGAAIPAAPPYNPAMFRTP